VLVPPGEPWDDANGNAVWDPGETFVNLAYATTAESGLPSDDMVRQPMATGASEATCSSGEPYRGATTASRDGAGLPLTASVNLFGILYNAGDIVAEGSAAHFGSLVAGGSFVQATPGAASPIVWFDHRIARGTWPPAEIRMPRTVITFWQTQHP
jgi:hypothetical protein